MEQFNVPSEMLGQWMKMEQERLRCAEEWADNLYKEAVLASSHSELADLRPASPGPDEGPRGAYPQSQCRRRSDV
jgi:hypothetical protein